MNLFVILLMTYMKALAVPVIRIYSDGTPKNKISASFIHGHYSA